MQNDKNIYKKIEAYLNGKLNGDELADFERKIQKDPDLAQDIEVHKDLMKTASTDDVADFERNLKKIEDELSKEEED